MNQVTSGVEEQARRFGIEVIDVRIRRVDLPEEVQNSVFARMKAERERIAKRYRVKETNRPGKFGPALIKIRRYFWRKRMARLKL